LPVYDTLAELPVRIDSYDLELYERFSRLFETDL